MIHDLPCGATATNFTVAATESTIIDMIKSSADTSSPYVVDVDVTADGDTCTDTDGDTIGARVTIGSKCYENINPYEYNVYDFSEWSGQHTGNDVNTNFLPITQHFAEDDMKSVEEQVNIKFPSR